MSTSSLLRVGVTGLQAHQAALRTTGHNISNADTPGYSRQTVHMQTLTPQFTGGAGYQGRGVEVAAISRVADDFLTGQLRLDTTAFNELDGFLTNISQIDSLLADQSTGIAPGIQSFHASLNGAADDPTSIPARQLVLSEAESLRTRFETIYGRLEQHNNSINLQLDTLARDVTSIGAGLAELNDAITTAFSRGGNSPPNDLLDTRDEMLRQLSEVVSVTVVNQSNHGVDVFIGNGQALVVGNRSNQLLTAPGDTDRTRAELVFDNAGVQQNVTRAVRGGKIGSLLSFRGDVLDHSFNALGRLSLAIADRVNTQHQLGLDLSGQFGASFFEDINEVTRVYSRVAADTDNPSAGLPVLSVTISDTTRLTESDYLLDFPGPRDGQYTMTRLSDGVAVARGVLTGALPETIAVDGFTVNVEAGQVRAGDRFHVMPTRTGARELNLNLTRPDQIAFASAVSAASSLGNEGSARVTGSSVIDRATEAFAVPGSLAPPLLVRFTSAETYDVLDNSNPARPVQLEPPLRNQAYTPGVENALLPDRPGETAVSSTGYLAGRLPAAASRVPFDERAGNGYSAEVLSIRTTDPATGIVSLAAPVGIVEGETARSVASRLGGIPGVAATARTTLTLTGFANDPEGLQPAELIIGGIVVNGPDAPDLLNPNYVADAITADERFAALGIIARSNSSEVVLESIHGEDITVALRGDFGDSVSLRDVKGDELHLGGAGGATPAAVTGAQARAAGFNFDLGGPYTMTLALPGGGNAELQLRGNRVTGRDIAAALQDAVDASPQIPRGDITVAMGPDGRISMTSRLTGSAAGIDIVDISPGMTFALGFEAGSHRGAEVFNEVAVGGVIDVVLQDGVALSSNAASSNGNLFVSRPEARSTFLGYQVTLDGIPEAGDTFTIEWNGDGVSDNRNALALMAFQNDRVLDGGSVSVMDGYGSLVEFVGALTAQMRINTEASEALMQQSQSARDSVSGVNLDEEAADLIRLELAYNASAQVITIARSLFDTLLSSFR